MDPNSQDGEGLSRILKSAKLVQGALQNLP